MYRMYSTGHPHIPVGKGETRELAILNFVKNADSMKIGVRRAFESALGKGIEEFMRTHSAEETFVVLDKSGNYGELFLESEKEATFRERITEIIDGIKFEFLSKELKQAGVNHAIRRGTKDIYIPCSEVTFYTNVKFFIIRENGDSSSAYLKIASDDLLWIR